jgi:hypothetical protein
LASSPRGSSARWTDTGLYRAELPGEQIGKIVAPLERLSRDRC